MTREGAFAPVMLRTQSTENPGSNSDAASYHRNDVLTLALGMPSYPKNR